jgi:hypothetical protein
MATIASMKRRAKWLRKLSARQIRHLEDTTSGRFPTLRALQFNLEGQKRTGCVCHECRSIALALGLEE